MQAAVILVLGFIAFGHCQQTSDGAEDEPFEVADVPEDEVIIAHLTEDNMVEVEDMVMTREQFEELFQPAVERFGKRVAVAGRRWPNGVVPYEFAADLLVNKTAIRQAMNEWEKHTCVRFIPKRPTDKAYIIIRGSQSGCSSSVGCHGGVQYINLGKNCGEKQVLLHELGHTIGLFHEQQHPDRDKYIKILWNNIPEANKPYFTIQPAGGAVTLGIPYDPASIMHYHPTAFSSCPTCKSIEPHDPALLKVIGYAQQLSPKSDIPIVKKMYSCK